VDINLAGSGDVEICWGDGQKSKYILRSKLFVDDHIIHTYSDTTARTITIVGNDIRIFHCGGNQITYLEVSKNKVLESLSCQGNQLTSLDLSMSTELRKLECGRNQLKMLDINKNTVLEELGCENNQLVNLEISNNVALRRLYCWINQLASLDASKNEELQVLNCCKNNFSDTALNALFDTLYDRSSTTKISAKVSIYGNPGTDDCDKTIAEGKGWEVVTKQ